MNTYECLSSTGCGLFMTPWQVSTDWLNVLSSWLIYKLRSDCKPYSMHFEQRFPIQAVTSRAEKFSFFAQVFFFCCVQLIKEHTHSHQCPTVDVINVVATIIISPNQSDECPSNINCNLRFLPFFFPFFVNIFCFTPCVLTGCGRYTVKSESPNENECKYCGGAGWRKKSTLPIEIFMWDRPQFQFWLNYSKIRFLFCFVFFFFVRGGRHFLAYVSQRKSSGTKKPKATERQRLLLLTLLHFTLLHFHLTPTRATGGNTVGQDHFLLAKNSYYAKFTRKWKQI